MQTRYPALQDKDWLQAAYTAYNPSEIGRVVGCPRGAVLRALHTHGLPIRTVGQRVSHPVHANLQDRNWLQRAYATHTLKEMAQQLRCSVSAVVHAMNRLGLQRRQRGSSIKPDSERFSHVPKELLDARWLAAEWAHKSAPMIAAELQCSRSAVLRWVRRYGLEVSRPGPRRSKTTYQDGYVQRYESGTGHRRRLHRLVMEQSLGRYLGPEEHVHHRNGDKADNRPENLQVMTNSEHRRLHAQIKRPAG